MLTFSLLLVPVIASLACLLIASRRVQELLHVGYAAVLMVLAAALALAVANSPGKALTAAHDLFRADALSAFIVLLTAFVSFVCSVYAVGFFRRDLARGLITERQLRLYYVLAPLFVSAMCLVPLADNLGVMWVAIESTTLASVLLVTFYNQKTSFEAGWKYIILGSVGISLALFGTVITYSSAVRVLGPSTHDSLNWSVLVNVAERFDPTAMRLAFLFIVLGYGTKAGLAPMHTWKPDAYSEAPVPAAALMGAAFINCAVYAIMRFHVLARKCLGPEFPGALLIAFGVCSILVAAPFILAQRNYRRLLAYSSIDHAGIMVAAIGFGGKWGTMGALLHMLFHAGAKPLMFFSMGNVQQAYGTPYMRRVSGILQAMPRTGLLFMLATLAITGLPPFGLFQSEFSILMAAMDAHHHWAAGLFTLGIVTIFAGFLIHVVRMNLGTCVADDRTSPRFQESPWQLAAMFIVAALITVQGVWLPPQVTALLRGTAAILGGAP